MKLFHVIGVLLTLVIPTLVATASTTLSLSVSKGNGSSPALPTFHALATNVVSILTTSTTRNSADAYSFGVVPTIPAISNPTESTISSTLLDTDNTTDHDHFFEKVLQHRAFNWRLLRRYSVECNTTDNINFPHPAGRPAYTRDQMLRLCRRYHACNDAGAMFELGRRPWWFSQAQLDRCAALCRCEVEDDPTQHYAANFGCLAGGQSGGWVMGGIGAPVGFGSGGRLEARDDDGASEAEGEGEGQGVSIDAGDGCSFQAHHGPARKDKN